jgi:hypothetical protein
VSAVGVAGFTEPNEARIFPHPIAAQSQLYTSVDDPPSRVNQYRTVTVDKSTDDDPVFTNWRPGLIWLSLGAESLFLYCALRVTAACATGATATSPLTSDPNAAAETIPARSRRRNPGIFTDLSFPLLPDSSTAQSSIPLSPPCLFN